MDDGGNPSLAWEVGRILPFREPSVLGFVSNHISIKQIREILSFEILIRSSELATISVLVLAVAVTRGTKFEVRKKVWGTLVKSERPIERTGHAAGSERQVRGSRKGTRSDTIKVSWHSNAPDCAGY